MSNLSEVFDDIYRNDRWGNGSGPGSQIEVAHGIVNYVNESIIRNDCDSLLDIGCGDGQLSSHLQVENYLGVDVSMEALNRFRSRSTKPTVCMDAEMGRWIFDAVLIKDVLQHMPFESCRKLLLAVSQCRRIWVINDTPEANGVQYLRVQDCSVGSYRPIDPTVLIPEFQKRKVFLVRGFVKTLWEWTPSEGEAPTER